MTEEEFLKEVSDHKLNVIVDSGIYRHLRVSRENDSFYWYEIITWPGYLCICGDCGTYVFSRVVDMFSFFRSKDDQLRINPSYWGEKLQAHDRVSGFMEFDTEAFKSKVKEHLDAHFDYVEDNDCFNSPSDFEDYKKEIIDEVESSVIASAEDGEIFAYTAINNFEHRHFLCHKLDFRFQDFFDGGGTERYSHRYLWCLYAIVYAIKLYDRSK